MAKKKATRSQTQAVRTAWRRVRQSLTRAEAAMRGVVEANRALVRALGKAGVSMTQSARKDLDARIRKLDTSRRQARKQLDDLTRRLFKAARSRTSGKTKSRRR